jgi:hypothetical protein
MTISLPRLGGGIGISVLVPCHQSHINDKARKTASMYGGVLGNGKLANAC